MTIDDRLNIQKARSYFFKTLLSKQKRSYFTNLASDERVCNLGDDVGSFSRGQRLETAASFASCQQKKLIANT